MTFRLALIAGLTLAGLVPAGRAETIRTDRSLKDSRSSGVQQDLDRAEENLALARTEADFFHKKWAELRIRTEALGLEALTGNEKALQDKVARLAGELYRSEKARLEMEDAITTLIATAREFHQAGPLERAQKRAAYEVAVRRAAALTGREDDPARIQAAADHTSGFVTTYDDEFDVVIANFGRAQGARTGMPYRILRGDKVIGRCRLIEVREYLSAALVDGVIEKETVKAGDRLLLETVK